MPTDNSAAAQLTAADTTSPRVSSRFSAGKRHTRRRSFVAPSASSRSGSNMGSTSRSVRRQDAGKAAAARAQLEFQVGGDAREGAQLGHEHGLGDDHLIQLF